MKVRIKIHEFDAKAHAARQALPVLDTIDFEKGDMGVDEALAAAKLAVAEHTKRTVRTISNVKGGGYAAIVT